MSVRLLSFYFGGPKLVRIFSQNCTYSKRNYVLNFVNRHNAKNEHSNIFYEENHLNVSKIDFHSKI